MLVEPAGICIIPGEHERIVPPSLAFSQRTVVRAVVIQYHIVNGKILDFAYQIIPNLFL